MTVGADFELELLDKITGPLKAIRAELAELNSIAGLDKLDAGLGDVAAEAKKVKRELDAVAYSAKQVSVTELGKSPKLGWTNKVKQHFEPLGADFKRLGAKLAPLGTGLTKVGKAPLWKVLKQDAAAMGAGLGKMGSGLASLGRAAAGPAFAGLAAVAAAGYGASRAFGFAADLERVRKGFTFVAGGAKEGAAAIATADRLSVGLALNLQDTRGQMLKFLGLGFDQKQGEGLIKMGADMKALGLSAEQVSGIMGQLGQIKSKGKLQGEELIVLAENGLSIEKVYDAIGKKLGKTRAEVLKLQAAGGIDASTALNAISAAVTQTTGMGLGEAGQRMADETLDGMITKLKNRATRGFEAGFAKADGGLKGVMGKVGGIVEGIMPVVEKAIPVIVDGLAEVIDVGKELFGSLFDGASETFGLLGDGDWAAKLKEFALGLKPVFRIVGMAIGAIPAVLGVVGSTAIWLQGIMNSALSTIGAAIQLPIDMFQNLIFTISDTWQKAAELFDAGRWSDAGMAIITGLWQGIERGAGILWEGIKGIAEGMLNTVKATLGIASPSKEFAKLGAFSAEGFAVGVEKEAPATQQSVGSSLDFSGLALGNSTTYQRGAITHNWQVAGSLAPAMLAGATA